MTQRLSASSAGRIMSCHASANLDLAIPGWTPPAPQPKSAATTGTDVHNIIEQVLRMQYITPSRTTNFGPKDVLGVAAILQYVGELMQTRRFTRLMEEKVQATWLTTKPTTQADLVLYTKDEIHVLDYKWGTVPVEVTENEQAMFYGLAYAPLAPKAKGVTLHILQPRANIMDSWFASTIRLHQFMQETIAAEVAITAGDTTFGPSHHCTFCPANPHSRGVKGTPLCPAMMDLLYPKLIDEDEVLNL